MMQKFICVLCLAFAIQQVNAQQVKAKLVAAGLTCSMCSKAVYQSLTRVKEVESVKSNIKESSYAITFKQGTTLNPDNLQKAVKDAGFSVAKLQLTLNFEQAEVANDAHLTNEGINLHFLNVQQQVLNGEQTITIVDNGFLPSKEQKQYGKYTTMQCFTTGKMAACCSASANEGQRIYHVTL